MGEGADKPEGWHGEERRGIPIHVLNYVDERLEHHTSKVEKLFTDHTSDEMDRYNAILQTMTTNRMQTSKEIEALSQSIVCYMDRGEEINKAFLENAHGLPDYEGHKHDHATRKRFGEWWGDVKDKTLTKVIEWATLAGVVWVAHSMWEAFLKGPVGK